MVEEIVARLNALIASDEQVKHYVDKVRVMNGMVVYDFNGLIYCTINPVNGKIETHADVSNEEIAANEFPDGMLIKYNDVDEAMADLVHVCGIKG